MNRAERRRAIREAGRHRADAKRGSRPALRVVPKVERFDALERGGFVIARPKVEMP